MALDPKRIQADWEEREIVEGLIFNVKRVTDVLNRFDAATRFRLAAINEKLAQLEIQMSYLEAAAKSAKQ